MKEKCQISAVSEDLLPFSELYAVKCECLAVWAKQQYEYMGLSAEKLQLAFFYSYVTFHQPKNQQINSY